MSHDFIVCAPWEQEQLLLVGRTDDNWNQGTGNTVTYWNWNWLTHPYHTWSWLWKNTMHGGGGPVAFSICMHNMQFHFCEVDLDFERMEEWRMETLWHFPFAYATPPRFMPLPVQCGKFQLQYEDTGNFEIDFREEFSQNIKTLNNCEKVLLSNLIE